MVESAGPVLYDKLAYRTIRTCLSDRQFGINKDIDTG